MAHGIGHAADVRLLHGITVGGKAAREFGLVQRCTAFLFVELSSFFYTERPLTKRQATAQFVFGQMPRQGDNHAPLRPEPKTTVHPNKTLVLTLGKASHAERV